MILEQSINKTFYWLSPRQALEDHSVNCKVLSFYFLTLILHVAVEDILAFQEKKSTKVVAESVAGSRVFAFHSSKCLSDIVFKSSTRK